MSESVTGLTQLATLINQYRQDNGLPEVPISGDLMAVALAHVMDLNANQPHTSCGAGGNMHSWSDNPNWNGTTGDGAWKGCCYPSDHSNAACMWDKPKEITGYSSNGHEVAHWSSGTPTPQSALSSWKASTAHNAVILNQAIWANQQWNALGAAVGGHYACAWFGTTSSRVRATGTRRPGVL